MPWSHSDYKSIRLTDSRRAALIPALIPVQATGRRLPRRIEPIQFAPIAASPLRDRLRAR